MANDKQMWEAKEKRELFCKSVNTMLMRADGDEVKIDIILEMAKMVVDRAFENYQEKDNTDDPEL